MAELEETLWIIGSGPSQGCPVGELNFQPLPLQPEIKTIEFLQPFIFQNS